MITRRTAMIGLAAGLAVILAVAIALVWPLTTVRRSHVVGYFANSNGLFVGDDVRILGVTVGKIDKIEPEVDRVRISFWYNQKYSVPADVKAAILSPSLVASRAIQLTPPYVAGPKLPADGAIPLDHTAVPVEWDDFRAQIQKLTESMQPTQPGGVSTFGALINTAADNLRGQGSNIHDSIIKLSQALSAMGDHSNDIFSTVKNLSVLVSALHENAGLLEHLNQNLATVTALLADDPNAVEKATHDLNDVVSDVTTFMRNNRDALGTTSDRLSSITAALVQSSDDIKQVLHVAPTTYQNFANIFEPAHGSLVGAPAITNFSNPIQFLCSAIQAASRLGAEQSSKLCVQYLAPIIKNRQYNYPPLGINPIVGPKARPNELTYSEDWMRPDYVPPAPPPSVPAQSAATPLAPAPAEAPAATDPSTGLAGMMTPPGAGS